MPDVATVREWLNAGVPTILVLWFAGLSGWAARKLMPQLVSILGLGIKALKDLCNSIPQVEDNLRKIADEMPLLREDVRRLETKFDVTNGRKPTA